MIVKIQRSLSNNVGHPTMLIYNENRTYQFQAPLHFDVAEFLGLDYKAYAEIELSREHEMGFVIQRRVPAQEW